MTTDFALGTLIAEREMEFEASNGARSRFVVRIGKPVIHEGEPRENWVCPFQVEGLGYDKVRGIFGVDAMQALLLCIHTIPAELGAHLRKNPGRLLFFGENDDSFVHSCRTVLEYSDDVFPRAAQ